jgi:hypothetical protein
MEKCPPAEACRDAFERMSKATVQMCLSTPGFGLSNDREMPPPRPVKREPSFAEPMSLDPQPKQDYARIAPKPKKAKRPPPQFDMDLRGLFPEDLDASARPSNSFPLNFQGRQHQSQQLQAPFSQPATNIIPQQTSPASSLTSPINSGLGLGQGGMAPFSPPPQPQPASQQYIPNTYNPDFMDISSLPGMDFLNMANPATTSASASANQASANDDLNYDFSPGLDLGFGVGTMGLDFSHDFSDGQQFDLFDGFFFGNGNGGG